MSWVTEYVSDDPEYLGRFLEALVDLHYAGDWGRADEAFRAHDGRGPLTASAPAPAPEPEPVPVPVFRSPMEEKFWRACRYAWGREKIRALRVNQPALVPGRAYRLDFAVTGKLAGIEIDGFATHSSTADIENDRRRQRDLEAAGWRITRFGGREVYRAPERCAREALKLIEALPGTWS